MDKAQQIVQSAQPTNSGMVSRYSAAPKPRRSPPKDYSATGIWIALFAFAVVIAVFWDSMGGQW